MDRDVRLLGTSAMRRRWELRGAGGSDAHPGCEAGTGFQRPSWRELGCHLSPRPTEAGARPGRAGGGEGTQGSGPGGAEAQRSRRAAGQGGASGRSGPRGCGGRRRAEHHPPRSHCVSGAACRLGRLGGVLSLGVSDSCLSLSKAVKFVFILVPRVSGLQL